MASELMIASLLLLMKPYVSLQANGSNTSSGSLLISESTDKIFTTLITPSPASSCLSSFTTVSQHSQNINSSGNSSEQTQMLIVYISVSVAVSSILFAVFFVLCFCRAEKRRKNMRNTDSSASKGEVCLNFIEKVKKTVLVETHKKNRADQHLELLCWAFNGLFESKIILSLDRLPLGDLASPSPSRDFWEVASNRLELGKKLGEGAFGYVFKADLTIGEDSLQTKKVVAVKIPKEDASSNDKEDLMTELRIMKKLKPHPNVVSLIGAVLNEANSPLVIVEFIPFGDLLGYLRKMRGVKDSCYSDADHLPLAKLCTSRELMKFAIESAQGMEYLSMKKIIHRDLAARNVLVGSGKTCKITDFGMARDVRRDEIYLRTTRGLIPVKWTAIESVLCGIYTTRSDVWSFGVLLFEIFTVGGFPYPGMDGYEVRDFISQGNRIPKPMHVDNELYQVMMDCWHSNPRKRPTFKQLVCTLKRLELCHQEYINMSEYRSCNYENIEDFQQDAQRE